MAQKATDLESSARLLDAEGTRLGSSSDTLDDNEVELAELEDNWDQSSKQSSPRWARHDSPGQRLLFFIKSVCWWVWNMRWRAIPKNLLTSRSRRCTMYLALILLIPGLIATSMWYRGYFNKSTAVEYCTTWPVDNKNYYDPDAAIPDRQNLVQLDSLAPEGGWVKPKGVKVVAMVFFGRRRMVDMLDCYLKQNLASNGGYLDQVWFMSHTGRTLDQWWLRRLVAAEPYYRMYGSPECDGKSFSCLWSYADGDDTIYIKIDDDIVYIHPDAIPQLVHTRLAMPHPFAISANMVNSPVTGMQQYHYGAIHPFLPDTSKNPTKEAKEAWRPSEFPSYTRNKYEANYDMVKLEPPYPGHPWLLVSDNQSDLLITPMGKYYQNPGSDAIAWGPAWKSWGIAAQQQYSLLYNIERNTMYKYFFGAHITFPEDAPGPNTTATMPPPTGTNQGPGGEQTYDMQYMRYNINFLALWGSDIREYIPFTDNDEEDITVNIPRYTGRTFLIDTRAVVAHLNFGPQKIGLAKSDIMDRWRALANEAVCQDYSHLKDPFDSRCEGF